MFTVIVMVLLIVWALKQICGEIGLSDALRKKIDKTINDGN
jgi:hypothetical protein